MLWSPAGLYTAHASNGRNGTLLSGPGTFNTKGPWTEVIASSPADAHLLTFAVKSDDVASSIQRWLFDIGIGAAGSESVLIGDILTDTSGSPYYIRSLQFPIFVPSGSRVAVRFAKSGNPGTNPRVFVGLWCAPALPVWAATRGTTYGANPATTAGTPVIGGDPYGSWTELAASTSRPARALVISGISAVPGGWAVQFGVGPAGSEVAVTPDIVGYSRGDVSVQWMQMISPYLPLSAPIPAGSRLVARLAAPVASVQLCAHLLE